MILPTQIRLYLLKVINFEGNIEPLKLMGYEYSQIVIFINYEIEQNNAEYLNGKLILTKQGKEALQQLEASKSNKQGANRWIEPEIQSQSIAIDKNDVFLPNQDDLKFD